MEEPYDYIKAHHCSITVDIKSIIKLKIGVKNFSFSTFNNHIYACKISKLPKSRAGMGVGTNACVVMHTLKEHLN